MKIEATLSAGDNGTTVPGTSRVGRALQSDWHRQATKRLRQRTRRNKTNIQMARRSSTQWNGMVRLWRRTLVPRNGLIGWPSLQEAAAAVVKHFEDTRHRHKREEPSTRVSLTSPSDSTGGMRSAEKSDVMDFWSQRKRQKNPKRQKAQKII